MHFELRTSFSALLVGWLIVLSCNAPAFAQSNESNCGSLENPYGPLDYRTDRANQAIVERAHFTPEVEALIRGKSNYLGGDLDYTLRAIPNHHRALMAVMRYGEKVKSPQPNDLPRSVECYFERAIRFRPDDNVVRMIYATFLAKNVRESEAAHQLALATASAGDNAFSHYNIGLVYFDLKDYDKALLQAHKALALGFNQTALRDQLQAVGKWTAPEGSPTGPASNHGTNDPPK